MKIKLTFLLIIISFICNAQNPNDCENSILVCGTVNIGIEPAGVGFDEFSLPGNTVPPCQPFNNQTVWFNFRFIESGTFTFDLIPEEELADYDFAIYGPNVDCTSLGESIRCSSTNPEAAGITGATGLNMTEIDVNEGPGPDGNGYLMFIDVLAGDEYIMLVDLPHGSGGFSLEMTGTATLPESPIAHNVGNLSDCDRDEETDGFTQFNFDPLIPDIIQSQTNVTVTFHESLNDANIGINPLVSPYTNTSNPQTIYIRIQNDNNGCTDFNEFEINVENPFEATLPQDLMLCTNNLIAIPLETEPGFSYYEWSTGEEGANLNSIEVISPGTYYVIISDKMGCKIKVTTTIEESSIAAITDITVVEFNGTENNATITVEGSGIYEFALDSELSYQDENIFTGLLYGYHTIFVRDKNGCGVVSREFLILDYPRFFTPNGDGVHDRWEIIGIIEFPFTKIYIYDRLGKLLKQINPNGEGWDGTYNGNPLPSNDYWFTIFMDDGRDFKGHFTLKR